MPIKKNSKFYRIMYIYEQLHKGKEIKKNVLAECFEVNEKTIRRDINEIKDYFENTEENLGTIKYDKRQGTYKLVNANSIRLRDEDIFAISKILLESKAFSKDELKRILDILNWQSDDNSLLNKILNNERIHYVEPKHKKNIIDFVWSIAKSISEQRVVKVKYVKANKEKKEYKLNPLGIVFNEYYFYLIAEFNGSNKNQSIVYRVDRFEEYEITEEKFFKKYSNRFEEGEFRKKIQFMYTGELMTIQFKFWGDSLEAILDRLPTARVINRDEENKYTIEAEVYGEGVKRWLLSQKEFLEVIRPEEYRRDIKETIRRMYELYS